MELTSAEKKVLSGISFNSEAIENDELGEKELSLLMEMRFVAAYLQKKYPDYSFTITGCEPMEGTSREHDEWFYSVGESGEDTSAFIARAKKDGESFVVTDDFYGEVIRDEAQAIISKHAEEGGFPVVSVSIGFWEYFGEDLGKDISAEDVLTGKIKAGNDIKIFLDGSKLQQSSHEAAISDLEKILKKKGITGDVYVVILKTADADPAKGRIFSDSFTL